MFKHSVNIGCFPNQRTSYLPVAFAFNNYLFVVSYVIYLDQSAAMTTIRELIRMINFEFPCLQYFLNIGSDYTYYDFHSQFILMLRIFFCFNTSFLGTALEFDRAMS